MKYMIIPFLFISNICLSATSLADLRTLISKEIKVDVRPYSTQDFGRAKYTNAISFLVPQESAQPILFKVREIIPKDSLAFIGTTRNLSDESVTGVEIVILASSEKTDILKASMTDGINYNIKNSDIIEKLGEWDKKYEIDIWQAETDTIQLTLTKLPSDLGAFSKEIYKFCPDIVDQGSGNISDITNYLKQEKSIYLWWD